ncbi:MAG: APC family permease, partial [Thermoplasmatales archaeon]
GISIFSAIIAIYYFSSYISSAGGYYKYIEAATQNKYISKSVGFWHIFYVLGASPILVSLVVPWLFYVGLSTLLGIQLPFSFVLVLVLLIPAVDFVVGYFGIKLTSKYAITTGVAQVLIFTIMAIILVIRSPYNSISYFNIGNSTSGLSGFFLAFLIGGYLAYAGYGTVVSYGEEAKLSKQNLKKAIVTALLIMVAFDTFIVYAITAAAGPNLSAADSFFAPGLYITKAYMGAGVSIATLFMVIFFQLTSPMIFGNSVARTFFSLSRDGVLPRSLSKVHPKYKSPSNAVILVTILTIVFAYATLIPMFLIYGVSGLFYSWVLWGTVSVVFTLFIHVAVNESLPLLLHRMKLKINILYHIILPLVSSVLFGIAIYYSLIGLTGFLEITYILIPVWLILSVLFVYLRRKKLKVESMEEFLTSS